MLVFFRMFPVKFSSENLLVKRKIYFLTQTSGAHESSTLLPRQVERDSEGDKKKKKKKNMS